jgi:Domain of unknown function (DUF4340)
VGNNRNFIALVVVLALLGGLYFASSGRRSHMDATGGFVDLVEGQLSTDDVFGISVAKGSETLELVRGGDEWTVRSHFGAPANLNKVRSLLGSLEAVEGEFRSDDASVLTDYALDDSTAYQLSVRDESGTALVDLLLGLRSSNGCFVRRAAETTVYLADHNFLSDLGIWGDERKAVDPKTWTNLEAYKVDGEAVRRLEILGESSISLEKEFSVAPADSGAAPAPATYEWRVTTPENFLAVRTKAEAILSSLTAMRANDIVARGENPEGSGLGDEAEVVRILGEDGVLAVLRFGTKIDEDTAARYFRIEGEELVWALPEYVTKNIFKPVDELRPE